MRDLEMQVRRQRRRRQHGATSKAIAVAHFVGPPTAKLNLQGTDNFGSEPAELAECQRVSTGVLMVRLVMRAIDEVLPASLKLRLADERAAAYSLVPQRVRLHTGRPSFSWSARQEKVVARPQPAERRLLIAPANYAGQGNAFARAAELLPDVSAVNMEHRWPSVGFDFRADYVAHAGMARFSREWITRQRAELENFTHVLIEAGLPVFGPRQYRLDKHVRTLQKVGLVVGLIWYGTDIRRPLKHVQIEPFSPLRKSTLPHVRELEFRTRCNARAADRLGVPEFVSSPDLLSFRPRATWLPAVADRERWPQREFVSGRRVPRVLHAPSSGPIKGTDHIRPAMRALDREGVIEYVEAHGVAADLMPDLVSKADVVVEGIRMGNYGVASIEAMMSGRVAVSHVWSSDREMIRRTTGMDVPVVEATPESVGNVVRHIAENFGEHAAAAAQGPEYVARVNSPENAATVLSPFLDLPPGSQRS